MRHISSPVALAFAIAGTALAQDAPTRDALSLAAGYKAQSTCSATFNAGKTPDQIAADELTNIYAGYIPVMDDVGEAVIDPKARTVSVAFADDMPPRIAAYRPHLGCSSLPPGATADAARLLPAVDIAPPDYSDVAWPTGDRLPNNDGLSDNTRTALTKIVAQALAGEFGGATSAVLIVRDGRIVGERYKPGFDHTTSQRTWSVAKSIGATLIGAAFEAELIDLERGLAFGGMVAPGRCAQRHLV